MRWSHIGLEKKLVNSLAIDSKGELIASTAEGLFHSRDVGKSWQKIDTSQLGNVLAMAVGGNDHYFVGTQEKGIFRSRDNGKTWENVLQKKFHRLTILQLVVSPSDPNRIFAIKGQYKAPVSPARTYNRNQAFARMDNMDPDFSPYRAVNQAHQEPSAVLVSSSNGEPGSWEVALRPSHQLQPLQSVSFSGQKVCVVAYPNTLHCSEDNGKTFTSVIQIPENQANTVLDDEGTLITGGSTLAYFNRKKKEWTPFGAHGSTNEAVGLRSDRKGSVFVVANAALPGWPTPGIFMLKKRKWIQLSPTEFDFEASRESQRALTIKEIISDREGRHYVATENGVFLVERGNR